MALFVHVTERCEADAAGAGWQEDLEKLKNKVERAQDLQGFEHFPAPYRVKKKFPRYNARLIASMQAIGEHDIACFLSILTKADSAYDQFQNDPVDFGRRNFDGLFSDHDLQQIVAGRTAKTPPVPKPQPTEAEYSFLFRAGGGVKIGNGGEALIGESPTWVTKAAESPVKDRLTEFHKALESLSAEKNFIALAGRPGWGIFYVQHPELHTTVLLEPLTGDAEAQIPRLREKYSALLRKDNGMTLETLLRNCQRAYPDFLRFGEDEWLEVQKDSVANIALSPEETSILEVARQPQGAFPLFINGRAGSGKSTLLQYIFTEHLHRYLLQEQEASFKPPLYLTCSGDLLKHSREVVDKLLKCNASFLSAGDPVPLDNTHRSTMDSAFQEFRPFLLTHLPPEVRIPRFRPNNRVDFPEFRKLWRRKFGNDAEAKKYFGPDISWHIIRTYIKGMSAESYQDADDYRQFDSKERLVSDETFEVVFSKVWDNWYRPVCEDSGYWDDQDLARLLIEQDLVKADRPGVFCDEAQDFTRLELEIILRLCLFSNRAIAPQQIGCIPLVFAGDPFQTLNPTGFRWEATKAAFVEKFILSLDPNRRSGMEDLNYRELTYNYRSSRKIVLFSNLTQALRCKLFDLRRVSPQEPWAVESSSPPVVWFDSSDGAFWERLRKERGVTIIVPCGEGEEQEFVQEHPILRQWIRFDENGVPMDLNVFSANRAKGLEFDRVAVFGFGDCIQDNVLAPLRGDAPLGEPGKSLPLEYFINRLYVAVSRPKRRLFIVDSAVARERLWEFATNAKLEELLIQQLRDANLWEGKVGGMVEGLLEHFDADQSPNLEEEARNLETQGMSRSDPYLLRSAGNRYRLVGLQAKANFCSAEALFIDEKYMDAGRAFLDCGHPSRAVDAFWRAGRTADQSLLESTAAKPELENRLEAAFARFLVAPQNYEDGYRVLTKLADRTRTSEDAVAMTSSVYWTEPTRRISEKLVELGVKQKESADWSNLSALLGRLDGVGFGIKQSLRARVCYLGGDWANAVKLWESCNDKASVEYREAKARVAPYPERLAYLKELGKQEAILEAFAANSSTPLDGEAKRIVGVALMSARRYSEALDQFVHVGAFAELGELGSLALVSGDRKLTEKVLRLWPILTVQHSHWSAVQEYLNSGKLPKLGPGIQKSLAPILDSIKPEFNSLLAASLARSDSLTKLDNGDQKFICKFLRELDRSKIWRGKISAKEVGAAIERCQRFIDAVEFYESVLESAETDQEKRFAVVRWVISKERLQTYYRGEKQYRRADEAAEEISKVKVTHQIIPAELAVEYPELGALNELLERELRGGGLDQNSKESIQQASREITESQPIPSPLPLPVDASAHLPPNKPNVDVNVGGLNVKLSRENKRINLENQSTLKTATIRLSPLRCTSDDVTWTSAESANNIYRCEEWGLEADFSKLDTEQLVVLRFRSIGTELTLRSN